MSVAFAKPLAERPQRRRSKFRLTAYFFFGAIALALFLNRGQIREYILQSVIAALKERGIQTSFEDFSIGLLSLNGSGATVIIPRSFLSFRIDKITADLQPLPLFQGALRGGLRASLYGGTFRSEARYLSDGMSINFDAKDIRLADYPPAGGFGITNGLFSATSSNLDVKNGWAVGDAAVSLRSFAHPDATSLSGHLVGLPFDLSLPAITDLNAELKLAFFPEGIDITKGHITSSLGSIEGTSRLVRSVRGALLVKSLDAVVRLTGDGVREAGEMIKLYCGLQVISPSTVLHLSEAPGGPFPFRCTQQGS